MSFFARPEKILTSGWKSWALSELLIASIVTSILMNLPSNGSTACCPG